MNFWQLLRYNVERTLTQDPSAKSKWMVLLTYPHITALNYHYIAHKLYRRKWYTFARLIARRARKITGIEIHPGAVIGKGLFIDHGMGVVIGETTIIKDDVTLFHGVTLGGTTFNPVKRHPTVESKVLIGAGSKILGDVTIGQGSKIGCNVVLKKSIPPYSVVYDTRPDIKLHKDTSNSH